MPGVFPALAQLRKLGYRLVMVTNQDGLGTSSFPQADFDGAHQFMMDAFSSQGIEFDAVFICPHHPKDACECRKPKTRLVEDYVREKGMDASRSAMIGDRDTDLVFAQNLNIRGMKVKRSGTAGRNLARDRARADRAPRPHRAQDEEKRRSRSPSISMPRIPFR